MIGSFTEFLGIIPIVLGKVFFDSMCPVVQRTYLDSTRDRASISGARYARTICWNACERYFVVYRRLVFMCAFLSAARE